MSYFLVVSVCVRCCSCESVHVYSDYEMHCIYFMFRCSFGSSVSLISPLCIASDFSLLCHHALSLRFSRANRSFVSIRCCKDDSSINNMPVCKCVYQISLINFVYKYVYNAVYNRVHHAILYMLINKYI